MKMKKSNAVVIVFLLQFLFYSCHDDDKNPGVEYEKINFDKTTLQISRDGGSAEISSNNSDWYIYSCYEITDEDRFVRLNEYDVINEKYVLKSMLSGDWYSLYKEDKILKITLSPNISEKERSLLINIISPFHVGEIITINQK